MQKEKRDEIKRRQRFLRKKKSYENNKRKGLKIEEQIDTDKIEERER